MDLLLISIVASIAIVSVSFVTLKSIKIILSDDINLTNKIINISNKDC